MWGLKPPQMRRKTKVVFKPFLLIVVTLPHGCAEAAQLDLVVGGISTGFSPVKPSCLLQSSDFDLAVGLADKALPMSGLAQYCCVLTPHTNFVTMPESATFEV